jgi:hypothetical protein
MPSVWEVFGDVLGGPLVAPVIVVGAVIGIASSPTLRKRLREWGVQGLATAMAARDTASREFLSGGNGTSGMVAQMSHRVIQAAAEVKEEWEDFVEEARHRQHRERAASSEAGRQETRQPARRRRTQAHPSSAGAKRSRRRETE